MILQTLPTTSGWRLFKVEDQLDITSGPVVQTAIAHIAEDGCRNILVDLEGVKTADEPGVNALAGGVRQLVRVHPQARIAIVVRSRWLADALRRHESLTGVEIFRRGTDALRAITQPQTS